jgi:dTDP-4-dehydrorhamnose reductase
MKILITGVTGMLGKKVYDSFKKQNLTILGIARKKSLQIEDNDLAIGDLTDFEFLNSLKFFDPDVVIHTAANVNVNLCETNKPYTDLIHIEATKYIAQIFKRAKIIYISTDSVFSDKDGMFDEESITNPSNYYALTKFKGEQEVLRYSNQPYILRLNIYGYHLPLGNSLFEWGYTNLQNNITIKGFKNSYFNPLYSGQIAEVICQIISKNIPLGIYNLACNEYLSKYDFLVNIAGKFNLNKFLIEATTIESGSIGATRSLNTTLVNNKIKKALPDVDFSLDSGLTQLHQDFSKIRFHEKN